MQATAIVMVGRPSSPICKVHRRNLQPTGGREYTYPHFLERGYHAPTFWAYDKK